jgi:hypothetical protein
VAAAVAVAASRAATRWRSAMIRNPFYNQVDPSFFSYRDQASTESAANFPTTFAPSNPSAEYPKNATTGWGELVQGVTHDDAHWYITQDTTLWRIPRNRDLAAGVNGALGRVGIPQEILDQGGNHFGDLDYYEGMLYVPLEGAATAQLVVFEARSLAYRPLFAATLAQGNSCPWCAIDPRSGLLFSSKFDVDENGLFVYSVEADPDNGVEATFLGKFPLFDEHGAPMEIRRVQGGVFSELGHLYLVSDTGVGVLGFDMCTGRLAQRIPVDYQPERRVGFTYQELEGITLWDLDDESAPGVRGQLHVLMLENAPIGEDKIFFKHYGVSSFDKDRI